MNKFFSVLILIGVCTPLCAMNQNHHPRVEIAGVHRAGSAEFFTSFKHPHATLRAMVVDGDGQPCVDLVPMLGHYQNAETLASGHTSGNLYNFRVRLALIEYHDGALAPCMPASVQRTLRAAGVTDLNRVECFTAIMGDFARPDQAPIAPGTLHTCNVVLHPVIRRWRARACTVFDEQIPSCVCALNGAASVDSGVAVDRLEPLHVLYHDTQAFCPDNGRIYLAPSRGIITFWTVAVRAGRALAVFNVVANNSFTEALIREVAQQDTLDGVHRQLVSAISAVTDDDAAALVDACDTMKRAASWQPGMMPEAAAAAAIDRRFALRPTLHTAWDVTDILDTLDRRVDAYLAAFGTIDNAFAAALDNNDKALADALLHIMR